MRGRDRVISSLLAENHAAVMACRAGGSARALLAIAVRVAAVGDP
jgi:hypothetical protein